MFETESISLHLKRSAKIFFKRYKLITYIIIALIIVSWIVKLFYIHSAHSNSIGIQLNPYIAFALRHPYLSLQFNSLLLMLSILALFRLWIGFIITMKPDELLVLSLDPIQLDRAVKRTIILHSAVIVLVVVLYDTTVFIYDTVMYWKGMSTLVRQGEILSTDITLASIMSDYFRVFPLPGLAIYFVTGLLSVAYAANSYIRGRIHFSYYIVFSIIVLYSIFLAILKFEYISEIQNMANLVIIYPLLAILIVINLNLFTKWRSPSC